MFLVTLSPRRDGIHLSEKVSLAWASPASLGEAAGRFWCCCWVFRWCVVCYLIPYALRDGLCDDDMINMFHLKWKWHVSWFGMNWKAWVVWTVDFTWYYCYEKFLVGGWNMFKVWVGHNFMSLVMRDIGGASSVGRNSMGPLKGSPWSYLDKRT